MPTLADPQVPRLWREAWHTALYGPDGFYRRPEGPAGHFLTAAHDDLGPLLAEAVAALARASECTTVVDLGCGRGELLTALAQQRSDLHLVGVDVIDRPASLPADITWWRSSGGAELPDALDGLTDTLVVANEWLDVVPCTVAEVDRRGVLRQVLVDPSGAETLGRPIGAADAAWASRWWPTTTPGERVEIGADRDLAWARLLARIDSGLAVAIDYGHTVQSRPSTGTLTGYAVGTLVPPRPDGSCDLTAHVALDSLDQDERLSQREALDRFGVRAPRPPHDLARTDPGRYLHAVARAGALGLLRHPDGLGAFQWVVAKADHRPGSPLTTNGSE
ncbi:MAG: SAM-dependent methyltransferase [Nostocoides sp.]